VTVYRRNPLLMTVMGANPGPRTRKGAERALDAAISNAWARLMSGIQIPIMDIPRIFRDIKLEMAAGVPLDQAVIAVGSRYRVNRNPGIGEAILGGMAGALASRAFQSNPHLEDHQCATCGGSLAYQGTLGNREHYRCRACGMDVSTPTVRALRPRRYRKLCVHGDITNRCKWCRGRKLTAARRACIHGAANASRCLQCLKHQRPGGPVRNNPAISRSWDGLKPRPRLAILEFAGIPYEQARRLASRSWGTLPPSIQSEVMKGWQENPRRGSHARIHPNPSRGGKKRRMTMTVERFAAWVKRQNNPVMWRAFLAKFKGYENWTHGARSRKVTLEWADVPGVDGLWITYDGGKQPESTYIMPKGSKRKGAWKHEWDTMPDIKHDPEAGIVLTKLRGRSRITDFYHK